jgi:hypothetical protein
MQIEFLTTTYEWSTGKAPRGRGSWAFTTSETRDEVFFSPSMTYTEARAWMTAKLRAMAPADFAGFVTVKVLP